MTPVPTLHKDFVNDSGYSTQKAFDILSQDGVEIAYGGGTMRVHREAIKEAREATLKLNAEEHAMVRAEIEHKLRKILPKIRKRQGVSKKVYDSFFWLLVMREALKPVIN